MAGNLSKRTGRSTLLSSLLSAPMAGNLSERTGSSTRTSRTAGNLSKRTRGRTTRPAIECYGSSWFILQLDVIHVF